MGDRSVTVDVDGLRVTLFVCYDLRFASEFWAVAERTDAYVVPAHWPVSRRQHWRTLLRARAVENQAYMTGAMVMGQRLDNAKQLYLQAIRDGDYVAAIDALSGDRYTQHSTSVRDGSDGFIEFFADFVERNPVRDIEIVRGFEDGRYVFLHVVQDLNDGEYRYVTADIFDTDGDAKLIEHWDIIAELDGGGGDGRSQVDGPTEPTDLDRTGANKDLVAGFVDDVLIPGAFGRLADFVAADVAQHSLGVADGVASWQAFAADVSMRYVARHTVVGCGDLVAVLAESERRGTRHAVIDLYRVADGMIVEHWDVIEEITPEETWVNSGKF